MSAKTTVGLSIGIMIMVIMIGVISITQTQVTKEQSQENAKNVQQINATLNTFVDNWENRIKVSNEVNNSTQRQLLSLAHNQTKVLQTQISNEKNILGNLTDHRHVANFTRDVTLALHNKTLTNQNLLLELEKQALDIQNKTAGLTGPEYDKLADKKVENIVNWIVGNLTKIINEK